MVASLPKTAATASIFGFMENENRCKPLPLNVSAVNVLLHERCLNVCVCVFVRNIKACYQREKMLIIVITQMPTEWPRIDRKTRTIHR